MSSLIEAIQAKASIEQVMAELDLRWPEKGWKMACPLADHDDSHPSAHVYALENRWWCFGCARGGDVIDLWAAVRETAVLTAIRDMAAWLKLDVGGSWEPSKPREPSPEIVFMRAANRAHTDVLRHLRAEYPPEWSVRNPESWIALQQATFRAYDELLRRYRNGDHPPERAYDLLLLWRQWALGGELTDFARRKVYELDGRDRGEQAKEPGNQGRDEGGAAAPGGGVPRPTPTRRRLAR